jgi:hypothetical protein
MSRNHGPLAAAEPAPWVKTKMRAGRFFGALTGNQTLGRSLTAEKNQDRSGKVLVQEQNGGRENGSGRQTLFGARGTAGLPDPPVAAEMKHEPKTGSGKRKQLLGRTLSKERKCRHEDTDPVPVAAAKSRTDRKPLTTKTKIAQI